MDTQQLFEAVEILEKLSMGCAEKTGDWVPAISAIAGVFLGGVISFLSTYMLGYLNAKKQKEQITAALISEVKALLVIFERRKYLPEMRAGLGDLQSGKFSTLPVSIGFNDRYIQIYQANIDKLGVLEACIASKIIEFHYLVGSFISDVSKGGAAAEGADARVFEELIEILERAFEIGKELEGA